MAPGALAQDANAEARSHFSAALELVDRGAFEQAAAEFVRAYEIRPHFAVLYNLGQAYVALGRPLDAASTLERYLAEGGSKVAPPRRAEVQAELARQRARIGELTVVVTPDGASIRLDDREAGTSPLAAPIRVAAGAHVVSAAREGYAPSSVSTTVAGADRATVKLALEALAPPAPAVPVAAAVAPLAPAVAPAAPAVASLAPSGLAKLEVQPTEPGAEVLVDGAPLSPGGALPSGVHRVEVKRAGFLSFADDVRLAAGSTTTVRALLVPTPEYRRDYESSASRRRTLALALGALGAGAGIAAGAVFAWNDGRYQDWQSEQTALVEDARLSPRPADFDVRRADNDELIASVHRSDRLTLGLGIAGGALLAAGAAVFLTGDDPARYMAVAPARARAGTFAWGVSF